MTVLTDTQVVTASGGLVELGYSQVTTSATIGTSTTQLIPSSGNLTVVCDGSPVLVEVSIPYVTAPSSSNTRIGITIDGVSNQLGIFSPNQFVPGSFKYRLTPSAGSHTFSVYGYSDVAGTMGAGAATGSGAYVPAFLRVSKIVQATQWPAVTTGTIICTSSTRPASPFVGQQIYETDTARNYQWNGSSWTMRTKVAETVSSSATQSSMATGVTLTGMSITQTFNGLPVFANSNTFLDGPAAGNWISLAIYLDGVIQQFGRGVYMRTSEGNINHIVNAMFTPSAGSHTVDVRVQSQSVATWNSYNRTLNLFEIG